MTVTDTIVLSFATRYDIYWIVVKMPPATVRVDGGIGWLGLEVGGVIVDEGGICVNSLLVVTNLRFKTVYFVSGAVEHLALTVHYDIIKVAVEASFIAVEPFNIFQFRVFVELIEEAVAETAIGKRNDCENDIYPLGDCGPNCAVDKIVYAVYYGISRCIQFVVMF